MMSSTDAEQLSLMMMPRLPDECRPAHYAASCDLVEAKSLIYACSVIPNAHPEVSSAAR